MTATLQPAEQAILEWITTHTANPELAAQLRTARVRKRDNTRTGVFVYFEPNPAAAAVPTGVRPVCPRVIAPGLIDGAGCDLFLRDGRLHYLEVYARGGFLPDPLEHWVLETDT